MTPSPSIQIIERIADYEDIDPVELHPRMNEVIDPDALDRLFSPVNGGRERSNGSVTFHYCGYQINVTSSGEIEISESETTTS